MAHLKNFKSTVTRMGISNISQILSNLQIRFTKPITNNNRLRRINSFYGELHLN